MSKFFADDNDSGSGQESQESDSEHVDKFKNQAQKTKMQKRAQIMEDMVSSEEEERHKVVSEKDKRHIRMREIIERMKKKMNINDFVALYSDFDELNKELEKGSKIFDKDGVPRFYIRTLCEIENYIMQLTAEDKKKLSQNNNKSYNILKQKIKKHNKDFETQIKEFLDNPIDSEAEKAQAQQLKKSSQAPNQTEINDDDDDEDEPDNQDDQEESDEDDKYLLQSNDPMVRRRYWLKKEKDVNEEKDEERIRRQPKVSKKAQIDYEVKFQTLEAEDLKLDFSVQGVNIQMNRIVESRGRSGNQQQNIHICEKLVQHFTQTDLKKSLEILLIALQLQIDQAKTEGTFYINRQAWLQIFQNLQLLQKIYFEKQVTFEFLNTYSKYDRENSFTEQKFQDTLLINFSTLENELNKSFQNLDFYSQEYAERLSDLYQLIRLAQRLVEVYGSKGDINNLSKMSFKQLELSYFFSQPIIQKLKSIQQDPKLASSSEIFAEDITVSVHRLTQNVYKGRDDEQMRKATLYLVYNLALHGKYDNARELLQTATSQEQATQQRVLFQVHYNRALVQLGVAAFRQGLINESHTHLLDLMNRDKNIRDLLAQNFSQKSSEAESSKYNISYHLSINIEVIETVYLVSAMLLEVPNIHQNPFDDTQKVISKKFRQFCMYHDSQAFNGNPENTRDFIYAASKALGKGEWKLCWNFLLQLSFWPRIYNCDEVQSNILLRVKEQSLKCYLFTFKQSFTSLSLEHLAEHFEMPLQKVKTTVFRMIYKQELLARIDGIEKLEVVFQSQEFTKSNRIALQLIEKINVLTKNNEKVLDAKVGSYGFQQTDKDTTDAAQKLKQRKKKSNQKQYRNKNLLGRQQRQ